jgi:hypothetical protein
LTGAENTVVVCTDCEVHLIIVGNTMTGAENNVVVCMYRLRSSFDYR